MIKHIYPTYLKLSRDEERILEVLRTNGPLSIAILSKKLKKPRMTIYTPVRSLEKRGMILSKKEFKFNILSLKEESLSTGVEREIKGVKNLVSLYLHMLPQEKAARIQWIQPNGALRSAIESIGLLAIKNLNKEILRKGHIIEAILEDNSLDVYKTLAGAKFTEMAKSLYGRPYDVSYLSPNTMDSNSEIVITKQKVVYINWKDEIALIYKNKGIIEFYTKYFLLLKELSQRVNISEILTSSIA